MRFRVWLAFIVFLAIALRCLNLSAPLIGVHGWRQCDTAAVARNFYEEGGPIHRPTVDWRGDGPGYVAMEFPLYSYAVGALYSLHGEAQEWIGRFLAAAGGGLSTLFIGLLIAKRSDDRTALFGSTVFAILPLNVFYGRAFMPESWMLAALAGGIYFFDAWLQCSAKKSEESGQDHQHFNRYSSARSLLYACVSCGLISLACLLKLTSLHIGFLLAFMCLERYGWSAFKRAGLWLFASGVLVPVAAWYWHTKQLHALTGLSFGLWESDKVFSWTTTFSVSYWIEILLERLSERHLTYVGAVLALIGFLMTRSKPSERLFDAWLVAGGIYLAIVSRGHQIHEYYQLPLILPLCFFIGRVFAALWPKRAWAATPLLFTIVVLSALRLIEYSILEIPSRSSTIACAVRINRLAQDLATKNDLGPGNWLIVSHLAHPGDPSVLYLSGQQGWALPITSLTPQAISDLKNASQQAGLQGPRFLLVQRPNPQRGERTDSQAVLEGEVALEELLKQYPVIDRTPDLLLVDLKSHASITP